MECFLGKVAARYSFFPPTDLILCRYLLNFTLLTLIFKYNCTFYALCGKQSLTQACTANQLTGFYMRATLTFNWLMSLGSSI